MPRGLICAALLSILSGLPGLVAGLLGLESRITGVVCAQSTARPSPSAAHQLVTYLQTRVQQRPEDASSWRLLGKAYLQSQQWQPAERALRRAIELAPQSAAAHCDLAQVYLQTGRKDRAFPHFQQVIQIAPESDYAGIARRHLPADAVQQASFEVDALERTDRFPDATVLSDRPTPQRWFFALEMGALYNSNVTLSPTSRGFSDSEASSFQGFLNPDLEYLLVDSDDWRLGPTFTGYFSLNEGPLSDLNLQSYQGGGFIERSIYLDTSVLVPRVHYTYTLDEFDGHRFGERHALHHSLSRVFDSGNVLELYWQIDHTDFADDGTDPAFTSRDGWNNTVGLSHNRYIGHRWLEDITLGAEVQLVDAEGSDFAYNAVSLYADSRVFVTDSLTLILEGGWGYRDYHRFELTPSRNENVVSGGVRLRKRLSEHWVVAGVFRYDRFDSENEFFTAQRMTAGLVTVFEY